MMSFVSINLTLLQAATHSGVGAIASFNLVAELVSPGRFLKCVHIKIVSTTENGAEGKAGSPFQQATWQPCFPRRGMGRVSREKLSREQGRRESAARLTPAERQTTAAKPELINRTTD